MALASYRDPKFVPALARSSSLRFEVVETLAGLEDLANSWYALAARAALPTQGFQSFAWLRSWAENYADSGQRLKIVLGWTGNELALIWPLGVLHFFGLTILGFLGEPLCQYHDVLAVDGEIGDALIANALDFVRGMPHDILNLRRVREDSRLAIALRTAGARVIRSELAPFIDFGGAKTFEAFERSLSSKERANHRRRLRHIEKLGDVTFESPTSPEKVDSLIAIAMGFKREWALKGGHYAPSLFDPRFERCLRAAARASDPNASLHVFAISVDGRPVGVEISFGYRDRLFAHVLAPNPALSKFGFGNVLRDASIANAFAQGYQIYDLLAPANAFKCAWTSESVEVTDFSLPLSRRGVIADSALTPAKKIGRRWIQNAPPIVGRALLWIVKGRNALR